MPDAPAGTEPTPTAVNPIMHASTALPTIRLIGHRTGALASDRHAVMAYRPSAEFSGSAGLTSGCPGKDVLMTTMLAIGHMSLTFRFIFVTLGLLCFVAGALGYQTNWFRLEMTTMGLAFITVGIWWWDLFADVVNTN
jgi:hypothetical protein